MLLIYSITLDYIEQLYYFPTNNTVPLLHASRLNGLYKRAFRHNTRAKLIPHSAIVFVLFAFLFLRRFLSATRYTEQDQRNNRVVHFPNSRCRPQHTFPAPSSYVLIVLGFYATGRALVHGARLPVVH